MAQPPKSPTSLRIPEATVSRVHAWATTRGIPRNAAYVELINRGLKAAGSSLPPPDVQAAIKAEAVKRQAAPAKIVSRLKGEWKPPGGKR